MTIPGKTGDSFAIETTVYQKDGITIQDLTTATVVCEAIESGGLVVPADTVVISDPVGGIVDSFFADGALGNGIWNFYCRVTIDEHVKIVVTELIDIDDLLPEAT